MNRKSRSTPATLLDRSVSGSCGHFASQLAMKETFNFPAFSWRRQADSCIHRPRLGLSPMLTMICSFVAFQVCGGITYPSYSYAQIGDHPSQPIPVHKAGTSSPSALLGPNLNSDQSKVANNNTQPPIATNPLTKKQPAGSFGQKDTSRQNTDLRSLTQSPSSALPLPSTSKALSPSSQLESKPAGSSSPGNPNDLLSSQASKQGFTPQKPGSNFRTDSILFDPTSVQARPKRVTSQKTDREIPEGERNSSTVKSTDQQNSAFGSLPPTSPSTRLASLDRQGLNGSTAKQSDLANSGDLKNASAGQPGFGNTRTSTPGTDAGESASTQNGSSLPASSSFGSLPSQNQGGLGNQQNLGNKNGAGWTAQNRPGGNLQPLGNPGGLGTARNLGAGQIPQDPRTQNTGQPSSNFARGSMDRGLQPTTPLNQNRSNPTTGPGGNTNYPPLQNGGQLPNQRPLDGQSGQGIRSNQGGIGGGRLVQNSELRWNNGATGQKTLEQLRAEQEQKRLQDMKSMLYSSIDQPINTSEYLRNIDSYAKNSFKGSPRYTNSPTAGGQKGAGGDQQRGGTPVKNPAGENRNLSDSDEKKSDGGNSDTKNNSNSVGEQFYWILLLASFLCNLAIGYFYWDSRQKFAQLADDLQDRFFREQ